METTNPDNPGNTAVLSIFNVGADWEVFSKQLQEFFETSAIGEDRQVATLLTCISESVYDILKNLCYPARPITKTLPELVTLLDEEFKVNVLTYRKHVEFDELRQNEGVNEWYVKVKKAASECRFGQHLDFRVKDKFVTGMQPGPVLDRLCQERTSVILSELFEIALMTESTWKNEILCQSDISIKTEEIEFNLEELHHSIDIKEETSDTETNEKLLSSTIHTKEKLFKCQTCDRKYTRKQGLTVHIKNTHNNNKKPFRCKICDEGFAVKLRLTKHLKTHTGEKQFECKFCNYRFSKKSALQRHTHTHTGEKPFG